MRRALHYDTTSRVLKIYHTAYNLSRGRIFVIGGGKASGMMAKELEGIIPVAHITAGIINCKGSDYETEKIKIITAGHPIPDNRGIDGVKEMLSLKEKYDIGSDDTIICLISGGGSALMPYPATGLSLEDKQKTTTILLASGANIEEVNTVRKHLSSTKGGQLGSHFVPSSVIALIISDVIGNDLSVIASGPTYSDRTTFSDAINILKKYDLLSKIPNIVLTHLEKGHHGKVAETAKFLDNCYNYIIGDNRLALEAMLIKAREIGFTPLLVTAEQKGETTNAALERANEVIQNKYIGYDALIIGGETTPRLPTPAGKGGRNQHYAAESIMAMNRYPGQWVVSSVNSDGSDFLPDVAGAIVDKNSLAKARISKSAIKKYIGRFDSNTLLTKIGDSLINTGNTDTNVGDLILYLLQ
jgi:glycerate-2-kinase